MNRILRIKATIEGVRPPVWRRLEVPADLNLYSLHWCLQIAFGWTNSHLHSFEVGGLSFAPKDTEGEGEYLDSRLQPLWPLEGRVKKFDYTYDFGDNWRHKIEIEEWTYAREGVKYPRCTAGARACPPEDCGGEGGYEELLKALSDLKHENHEDMKEWVGPYFDPEAFDLDAVNKELRKIKTPRHNPSPGPLGKAEDGGGKIKLSAQDYAAAREAVLGSFHKKGVKFDPKLEKQIAKQVELRLDQAFGKPKGKKNKK